MRLDRAHARRAFHNTHNLIKTLRGSKTSWTSADDKDVDFAVAWPSVVLTRNFLVGRAHIPLPIAAGCPIDLSEKEDLYRRAEE